MSERLSAAVEQLADAHGRDVRLGDRRVLRWAGRIELAPGVVGGVWRQKRGLVVIAGMEPYLDGRFGPLRHVSFSHADRLPGWRDIKAVKAAFFGPERAAMIVLPRDAEYTNVHPRTHHLWEMPEAWSDSPAPDAEERA